VALALQGKSYEQYVPFYRKNNRWTDRVKNVDLPLFPGYVFCRMDVSLRRPVLTIPGVVNVVGFGNLFVAVPDDQIQAVHRIIQSGLPSLPWPFLRDGDRIRVRTGSLEGIEGFVVQIKNEYRVVVSVPLLQRSVAVEIDREWIQPLAASTAPAVGSGLSGISI